jgi:hypothetical protein
MANLPLQPEKTPVPCILFVYLRRIRQKLPADGENQGKQDEGTPAIKEKGRPFGVRRKKGKGEKWEEDNVPIFPFSPFPIFPLYTKKQLPQST